MNDDLKVWRVLIEEWLWEIGCVDLMITFDPSRVQFNFNYGALCVQLDVDRNGVGGHPFSDFDPNP